MRASNGDVSKQLKHIGAAYIDMCKCFRDFFRLASLEFPQVLQLEDGRFLGAFGAFQYFILYSIHFSFIFCSLSGKELTYANSAVEDLMCE